MSKGILGESLKLSQELIAFTLLLLPVCGLAISSFMQSFTNNDSNGINPGGSELVFNSALERFQRFVDAEEDENSYILKTKYRSIFVERTATADYDHQVAGHTCEELRGFKGKILKPMVKGRLFFRELCLYEKMVQSCNAKSGGLPKDFVPNYCGLVLVKKAGPEHKKITKEEKKDRDVKSIFSFEIIRNGYGTLRDTFMNAFIPSENDVMFSFFLKSKYNDGYILPHIVLDDLTLNCKTPCVIDIKMGKQTYEPNADSSKKNREIVKCPYQVLTGFRITGMKVYNVKTKSYSYREKQFGRAVSPDGDQIIDALKLFFWNGLTIRKDVVSCVIERLKSILHWFQSQNDLHFYCSSILIIYDGTVHTNDDVSITTNDVTSYDDVSITTNDVSSPQRVYFADFNINLVQVKMIDFAHTLPSPYPKTIDHGYVLGLTTLIAKLLELNNR
jgi:hypothetical protein